MDFESIIYGATEKIFKCMDDVLSAAQVRLDDIDLVYCTGGTSKLGLIQKGLLKHFDGAKILNNNFFHSVIEGLVARAQELI